jgi:hypothetical protein
MSAFGKFIPPFGQPFTAFSVASSIVSAQETWSWIRRGIVAGSLPASRAPFSKRPISIPIFSSAAPTVMIPSQVRPVRSLWIGPAVAT